MDHVFKVSGFGYDSKNHLHCGSVGSIIRFWILVKKQISLFGLKSPDLDFSKESTHGILKHRYAEFIVWEWDLDVRLVRHLMTGRFLK